MGETEVNVQELLSQEEVNYTHVDITDDFMFAYVMQRPDICIELLEYLFPGHEIQRVVYLAADEKSEADITIVVGQLKPILLRRRHWWSHLARKVSVWMSIWMMEMLFIMLKCKPQGQGIFQSGHVITLDRWI